MGTVPLPTRSTFIKPGRECWATGWGRTGVAKPRSDTLREVKLRLMEATACSNFPFYNPNLQICVGNPRKKGSPYKVPYTSTSSSQSVPGSQGPSGNGLVKRSPSAVTGVFPRGFLGLSSHPSVLPLILPSGLCPGLQERKSKMLGVEGSGSRVVVLLQRENEDIEFMTSDL